MNSGGHPDMTPLTGDMPDKYVTMGNRQHSDRCIPGHVGVFEERFNTIRCRRDDRQTVRPALVGEITVYFVEWFP